MWRAPREKRETMAQTRKFVSLSALAVLVCAPLLVGGAADPSSAAATGDDVAVTESVRVIDRSNEALQVPDLSGFTAADAARGVPIADVADPVTAEERPAVGETVQVIYSNAVVVHEQLRAGCEVSASAFNPYQSGQKAFSNATYKQTGCSGITQTSSTLQKLEWWGWNTRSEVLKGAPASGTSYGYLTSYSCPNTNSTKYRNILWHIRGGVDSELARSSEVTLSCGS